MRLGVCSYAFSWAIGVPGYEPPPEPMTAHELLDRAAALGVRVVQIADNLPLDRLSDGEVDSLARRAAALDIEIEAGARGCRPDYLLNYLRIARRLNSRILRMVADSAGDEPSPDEIVARLSGLVKPLEEAGVTLAIENHDRFRARQLREIVERLGSERVGVCLDTANSFGALEGPDAVAETLGPQVVNLHVKDVVVRRMSHNLGFVIEGRPAGQGQLDIPGLLSHLRNAGRDPNAILELWLAPEATMAATIEREAVWAAESVAYLRQLIPD